MIIDYEIDFIREMFVVLDKHLLALEHQFKTSEDPDTDGVGDSFEFVAGMGFVACQKYVDKTCRLLGVPRRTALDTGDRHRSGYTVAAIVNAAANYWKHEAEWTDLEPVRLSANGKPIRESRYLDRRRTRKIFWSMGVYRKVAHRVGFTRPELFDFPLINILYGVLQPLPCEFTRVLGFLEKWREDLIELGDVAGARP